MSFLKMTVIGNLGRDAEIREVGNMRVISFNVAHSEKFRDRNTNLMVERTTWVRCNYWRDADKIGIAQYLTKGKLVMVEGTPSVSTYINQQGQAAGTLECRVLDVRLLGGGSDSASSPSGTESAAAPQAQSSQLPSQTAQPSYSTSGSSSEPDFVEDDLPF